MKAVAKQMTDIHLILHMGNITAVLRVNKKAGTAPQKLVEIATEILEFCMHRKRALWAKHLTGKESIVVDVVDSAQVLATGS